MHQMDIRWPESFHFIGKSNPDAIFMSPSEVVRSAAAVHDLLLLHGVEKGDRVALWLSHGYDQLAAFLGCWMAGASFCVLPSFAGRSKTERSQERIDDVLTTLRPRLLLTDKNNEKPDAISDKIPLASLSDIHPTESGTDPKVLISARDPNDIAFVQFTSGSTGGAKGAVVRFGQLAANLDAIAARTQLTSDDCMVTWAPLYHDMGLMSILLPLSRGASIVMMETEHFVRRPTAWLEALSKFRGTVTTAPPTSLKLLTRRRAVDVDLSSLRYAWIGGEMVFPGVLEEFEAAYAPAGLARGVLQPTYGMAETVVGISCGHPSDIWNVEKGVISCGPPLEGIEMRVAGSNGEPVPAGEEGRIMVRGTSVMRGYLALEPFAENAWFDTGDLGFERDGRLYVTGRVKDVLKRGAESFPASLVEAIAEDALGLHTGRAAAFINQRPDKGKEELVLLVEARNWNDVHARTVATAVAADLGLQIDVIRNTRGGRLPRTSSGKLMRQKAATLYRDGAV
jgi:acyl-CoA synthetase (AMP-forming)/AMP-acid ligase II